VHTKLKTSDLYVLNWESSDDVMFFMCQGRQQRFSEFEFVFFRPRDVQEYFFYVQHCIRMEIDVLYLRFCVRESLLYSYKYPLT
jgi:hypothetical protein